MEGTDDDADLKLVKASAGLLFDLESALPRVLWRRPKPGHEAAGRVHTQVQRQDLDYILKRVGNPSCHFAPR